MVLIRILSAVSVTLAFYIIQPKGERDMAKAMIAGGFISFALGVNGLPVQP